MGELRTDPLTGRSVYLAEGRAGRPNDFTRQTVAVLVDEAPQADCPFCPGNEHLTPDPTFELLDDTGAWRVRAVPNKYPLLDAATEQGVHEVIIESPRHVARPGRLTVEELTAVLTVYAERLGALAADERFPYWFLFKNVGPEAGASLAHLHSQLVALPILPPNVLREVNAYASARSKLSHPWGDRLRAERATGSRVVLDDNGWLAFCPEASRQPFETFVMPVEPQPSFERMLDNPEQIASFASFLLPVLRAIEAVIGPAGYNLMLHTANVALRTSSHWHWRIEILPRLGMLAGFELTTGVHINTLAPEQAAKQLRTALAEHP